MMNEFVYHCKHCEVSEPTRQEHSYYTETKRKTIIITTAESSPSLLVVNRSPLPLCAVLNGSAYVVVEAEVVTVMAVALMLYAFAIEPMYCDVAMTPA